jgi:hypothetical protein
MFAKVEDYSYKRLNSASFSFEIFFLNELLNQIVPFTIYFESTFHQNPTILRQVPTFICCLPPLCLVYTRPGANIGQYWRQTGTRLVPPWRQAGAMMAPGWHTTQTFAGRPQLQDLTDILQCIRFLLRAVCRQTHWLSSA